MRLFKRFPIAALILANGIAFGALVGVQDVSAYGGGVDDCDEEAAEGCDCGPAIPFSPAGCFEVAIGEFRCESGEDCNAN